MSVFEKDLFGVSRYEMAISRIKSFCGAGGVGGGKSKRVFVAFSGGKDSQCCYHLAKEAGIKFDAIYSVTRFEPPQLIDFILKNYPDVIFRRAYKMPLLDAIEQHGLPSMFARWCCDVKHAKQEGYDISIIGIRWEESSKRREKWRMSGYKEDKTFYICPIADWTSDDVWEYLNFRKIPHCCIYDMGFTRIGCVCCPLSESEMERQAKIWPKTVAVLRHGSDLFVDRMRKKGFMTRTGKHCAGWSLAKSPEEEYFQRWIHTGQTSKSVDEMKTSLNLDSQCVFAGSGFSESDGESNETGNETE